MYSFGKEVKDFKEAEKLTIELIENGKFDDFLKKTDIDKNFLIENLSIQESFVLGIDSDFELEDLFSTTSQQAIIDEIKQREGYADSCLIVGDCSMYLEDKNDDVIAYFLASNAYSRTNTDTMLLLAVGFVLGGDVANGTKEFITV